MSNIEQLSRRMLLSFHEIMTSVTLDISDHNKHKNTKPCFYFHNMNKFDGIFILQLINILTIRFDQDHKTGHPLESQDRFSFIKRNGVFYEMEIDNICIRDSIHLITGSLNKLAKTFIGEQKDEIDIEFNYNSIVNNKDNIIKYCIKDSKLLHSILIAFRTLI
jgi:hypothetical protein